MFSWSQKKAFKKIKKLYCRNGALRLLKKPTVFLDRDGVINKKMLERSYVKNLSEFSFLPGVFKAIRMLKENGFLIITVTNQRCIATGIITEEKLNEIHKGMSDNNKKTWRQNRCHLFLFA